jgi:hypothetical protein
VSNADRITDARLGVELLLVETLNSIFKQALYEPATLNEGMPAPVLESNAAGFRPRLPSTPWCQSAITIA